jgi:MFS transporter, CP family, cyanate transporter
VKARGGALLAFALLWLCGLCLRLTVLAVPPVIHLIRSAWHLSGTEVGLLVTLPTGLFALVALPGAALVARLGARRTVIAGLVVTGGGAALRGAAPSFLTLLAATALMGAGIAVMQPTLPALVRRWAPGRVSLATATYSNGLLVGEIVPVALTAPLLLPALSGSWSASLAAWAAPVLLTALLVAALARRVDREPEPATGVGLTGARPEWRSALTWLLGLFFGCINATYFATNAFLPGYLTGRGRQDLIPLALGALNAGQLPAAFLMLGMAPRFERRARPFVVAGALCLAAVAGILASRGAGVAAWAALLGFGVSSAMILALALPALLHDPEHVAKSSAAMFTISYAGAIAAALLGGAAWDVTGDPRWAFAPVAISAAALGAIALALRARRHLR